MFLHCVRHQHKRNHNTNIQTNTHTHTYTQRDSELDKGNQGQCAKSVAYFFAPRKQLPVQVPVVYSHKHATNANTLTPTHTQSVSINQIGIQLVFVLLNLCCIVFYFKYDEARLQSGRSVNKVTEYNTTYMVGVYVYVQEKHALILFYLHLTASQAFYWNCASFHFIFQ